MSQEGEQARRAIRSGYSGLMAGNDPYRDQVVAALEAQGADPTLDLLDKALIEMGRLYGVGPVDCSYQIVSDRADARRVR